MKTSVSDAATVAFTGYGAQEPEHAPHTRTKDANELGERRGVRAVDFALECVLGSVWRFPCCLTSMTSHYVSACFERPTYDTVQTRHDTEEEHEKPQSDRVSDQPAYLRSVARDLQATHHRQRHSAQDSDPRHPALPRPVQRGHEQHPEDDGRNLGSIRVEPARDQAGADKR